MHRVNLILRVVFVGLGLTIVAFTTAVGYALFDPIHSNLTFGDLPAGWGGGPDVVMLFAGLAFIGLSIVLIVWLIVGSIRDDVRQETTRPPF